MKKIYHKYKDWVVIGLLILLGFKSCQSCSRSRTLEFNNIKHNALIDSLKTDILNITDINDSLSNVINIYMTENHALQNTINIYKEENRNLKDDNRHYRNTNRALVNTNNQIINKKEN